jgi:hypothetical protein
MRKSQANALGRPPILWVALGRQRVGKTVLLNTAVQYFRGLGNPIRVWNADQQNRTHTLSVFFPDAEEIGGGGIEDSVAWMEARIEDQIAKGYDAVLDVGGGATGFAKLVQEVPLLEVVDSSLLMIVGIFCVGPERADLDYLEQFAQDERFLPPATVIVFNTGLVLSGRSAKTAFAPIAESPALKQAVGRGAQIAVMPALACMSQVTDRELTFTAALSGDSKGDAGPLSLFDRARVNRWWSRDVPQFFQSIPPAWLPLPHHVFDQTSEKGDLL